MTYTNESKRDETLAKLVTLHERLQAQGRSSEALGVLTAAMILGYDGEAFLHASLALASDRRGAK